MVVIVVELVGGVAPESVVLFPAVLCLIVAHGTLPTVADGRKLQQCGVRTHLFQVHAQRRPGFPWVGFEGGSTASARGKRIT